MSTNTDKDAIRKFAIQFGIHPRHWDKPETVCALITPRVSDYLEHVHCDNADEATMDGDDVGSIPEYLK